MDCALEIKNLSKFYPPALWAVKDVSLSFQPGLIHAIIGENGAGKSTLMKICYGMISYESGAIYLNGKQFHPKNPRHALQNGIGMVHQEFMLFDELTIYENVMFGSEITSYCGLLDRKAMMALIQSKIDLYGVNLCVTSLVKTLSVAAKQKVELLKLLLMDSSILIFDEPTSVLTPQECLEFFKYLDGLKKEGRTIFYIGHKLEDILKISDTISILQKGVLKAHYTNVSEQSVSKKQLIADMIGTQSADLIHINPSITLERSVLSLQNISLQRSDSHAGLYSINLDLHPGEIIGVAAIEGHGQSELVQVIIGALTQNQGKIFLNNEDISSISLEERRKEIAFVSPNRTIYSSCQSASIIKNIIMGQHKSLNFQKLFGFLNFENILVFYRKLASEYYISIPDYRLPMSSLSGGNQQKIILAREYELNSPLILLEQPSRGLDVNSIQYVHNLILKKRNEGKAVFLVSSDLDELLTLSDRIIFIFEGRIIANQKKAEVSLETIGHMMLTGDVL